MCQAASLYWGEERKNKEETQNAIRENSWEKIIYQFVTASGFFSLQNGQVILRTFGGSTEELMQKLKF